MSPRLLPCIRSSITSHAMEAASPGQRAVWTRERAGGAVRGQGDGHGGAGPLLDRLHTLEVVERRGRKARAHGVDLDAFRLQVVRKGERDRVEGGLGRG